MKNQRKTALDILTNSFKSNGSVNYVVGNHENRIRRLMQYSYMNCLIKGEVIFHESNQSVMLINWSDTRVFSFRLMLEEVQLALFGIGWRRIAKVLRRESYIVKHRWAEPHIYLWFIGTHTDYQGRGYGSTLMKKLISLSNQIGRSVCLETSNRKNLSFYEGFGFHIYHESDLNELGYKLWFMKTG